MCVCVCSCGKGPHHEAGEDVAVRDGGASTSGAAGVVLAQQVARRVVRRRRRLGRRQRRRPLQHEDVHGALEQGLDQAQTHDFVV